MTELNVFASLAADEQFRVRLEDAEQLLLVRHTLAFEDPSSCLVHDSLAQLDVVIDLLDDRRGQGHVHDAR